MSTNITLEQVTHLRRELIDRYQDRFGSPFFSIAMSWLNGAENQLTQQPPIMSASSSIREINERLQREQTEQNEASTEILNEFRNLLK